MWERFLDAIALAAIAASMSIFSGEITPSAVGILVAIVAMGASPARRLSLRVAAACGVAFAKLTGHRERPEFGRLAAPDAWFAAFAASVVAWMLPGVALWGLGRIWRSGFSPVDAELAYASSTLVGALSMAPGGTIIAGRRLLGTLGDAGFLSTHAALTVLGIRLVTAGLSTVLGGLFLLIHLRSRSADGAHFDEIANVYDVQIPAARRHTLLLKKTALMEETIDAFGVGRRGLDVGCGQGRYVCHMRHRGFDVTGIDSSPEQVQIAQCNVGSRGLVRLGSVLEIPAADATYDFAYAINVLHHLASIEEQRAAFTELIRILRPGGMLFVHEINTRNVLFRFYMGYVFPSLNCIDEGVERWLLPNQLARYTHAPVVDIRYFTFLPEFLPGRLVTLLAPVERRLETSPLGRYSAHYMAAVQKPDDYY
jgi:2-polyprenyl-3-methyl-5-hydroxy-6-metoxy-1,4-benzoquinol methylase